MKSDKDLKQRSIALHRKLKGKISVQPKSQIKTIQDLSLFYTPGVGAVSAHIAKKPSSARELTIQNNTVAVVSDGSAVLGLGNIGPEAALPVMEGKAMLFKTFADIDAFPIVLATQDTEEIIKTVKNIAPTFGGINLEDISAPRCFEIEERLKKELSIPVMHDDQHGTAVVVLAGLINAFKVAKKSMMNSRVVVVGAGAAGTAVAKLLAQFGIADIVVLDSRGILSASRKDLNKYKKELVRLNKRKVVGGIEEALVDADAVIGVSGPKSISTRHIRLMADDPIVFALANPASEITPEDARLAGARIIATGRSDYPNQVNNSLVFPGIFRGALDGGVKSITDIMKVHAGEALAGAVKNPTVQKFIPGPFDRNIVKIVAKAVK